LIFQAAHRAVAASRSPGSRSRGLQILPDGVGAEQAVGYQLFVVELLMLVAHLVRLRGEPVPPDLLAAIDRSATFLAAVVGEHDPDPRFGDDDEGFAVRLGAEPVRTVRDHLGLVGAFFGHAQVRHAQARRWGRATPAAVWLEPPGEAGPGLDLPADPEPATLYAPHGGLVMLRNRGRRVLMDVGPLGYLSLAAHGHADALSVTVSLDGSDIINPGTGSSYGHPDWRGVPRKPRSRDSQHRRDRPIPARRPLPLDPTRPDHRPPCGSRPRPCRRGT
jgi:hypothetical protein